MTDEVSDKIGKILEILDASQIRVDVACKNLENTKIMEQLVKRKTLLEMTFSQIESLPNLESNSYETGLLGLNLKTLIFKRG